MKRIAIIGGGFCGTIAAVNLARLSSVPLHLSIVNGSGIPCRGVAYSTRNGSHLLNVVARNMSALADQPNHFVDWLGTRAEFLGVPLAELREKFVPRRVFGDYLHNVFQWHAAMLAEKGMRFDWIEDEARDILIQNREATVILNSGKCLRADRVILATGNQTPARFPLRGLDHDSPKYIGNPWRGWEEKLPAKDRPVLLIGTGLTMVDTFLSLQDLGWRGKILAVSRNGLLPLSHFKGFDYPEYLDAMSATLGLRKIFAIFGRRYRAARARDLNPAILVDKLRPFTQQIWQNFSRFEKRQFTRHFRTRWNVMRHRIAPEIHRQLIAAIAEERLEIIKGRLSSCEESPDSMKVLVRTAESDRTIKVGALINCTGPQESCFPSESSLLNNLIARGTIQPDEMNMGLRVASNLSVMDDAGRPSEILFAIGSLLRGTLWEITGVPELRSQTFRVAKILAEECEKTATGEGSILEVKEDVLEYFI